MRDIYSLVHWMFNKCLMCAGTFPFSLYQDMSVGDTFGAGCSLGRWHGSWSPVSGHIWQSQNAAWLASSSSHIWQLVDTSMPGFCGFQRWGFFSFNLLWVLRLPGSGLNWFGDLLHCDHGTYYLSSILSLSTGTQSKCVSGSSPWPAFPGPFTDPSSLHAFSILFISLNTGNMVVL